jgi:hypothetical protein
MHLSHLLSGGGLARTNSPDWLVGQHHLLPALAHGRDQGLKLFFKHPKGIACLPFCQGLPEAGDDLETNLERLLHLLCNNVISLSVESSPLGVA